MLNKMKFCLSIILGSLLTGCSLFSPIPAPQTNTFLLQPNNYYSYAKKNNTTPINLMVLDPTAPAWLNTTNMVYITQPSQVDYFSKNVWADTPAHMLQNNAVASLQQSGRFHAVVAEPFLGNYDKRLDLRILNFSQDFSQKPSQFRLQVLATLVEGQTQQVIASEMFSEIVPCQMDSPRGGVAAANVAVARLNNELLKFSLKCDETSAIPSPQVENVLKTGEGDLK